MGGVAPMPYKNDDDRKRQAARYYEEHKEELRAKQAKYYRQPGIAERNAELKRASRSARAKLRIEVARALFNSECTSCGSTDNLMFHHKPGETKVGTIAVMSHNATEEDFWEEVRKCTLLCKKCHYKEHHGSSFD